MRHFVEKLEVAWAQIFGASHVANLVYRAAKIACHLLNVRLTFMWFPPSLGTVCIQCLYVHLWSALRTLYAI